MFKRNPDVDIDILRFRLGDGTRYFTSDFFAIAGTVLSISADYLIAFPFFTPVIFRVGQIDINVTAAPGAGSARMGIYEDNGKIYPGKLLLDAGTVDISTTGVKGITVTKILRGGKLYWLAIVPNAGVTLRTGVGGLCTFGLDSTLGTAWGNRYVLAFTYAPLPDPFPAEATPNTGTASGVVFLRKDNY